MLITTMLTVVTSKSGCAFHALSIIIAMCVLSHKHEHLLKATAIQTGSHLMLDAWSVNSVATREKYFRILIQRLGLGMQPLCAWMAWIRAISLAISLRGDADTQKDGTSQKVHYLLHCISLQL